MASHAPPVARQSRSQERPAAADHVAPAETQAEPSSALDQTQQMLNQSEPVGQLVQIGERLQQRNNTGLPDRLKSGVEGLSGVSLDDVHVHYNSNAPAQLNAHAFAQGNQIHLGPGQERHLPHEAWHVVQQKQGRVRPTTQMAGGARINDDAGLEREADVMGARALRGELNSEASQTLVRGGGAFQSQVAQCAGNIRFANLSLAPGYQQKGQAIISVLSNTPSVQAYLATRDALITLKFDASNFASVREVGDQVQIQLAPWFFEQQSRGRILGMLAHELGVHPLADAAMAGAELNQENDDVTNDVARPTGLPGLDILAGQAGQQDHVFAAVAGQPRFQHYRNTVFGMAAALDATRQAGGLAAHGVEARHVTDLIMTYLSDISTILATNDHRGRVAISARRSAEIFNLERLRWLRSLDSTDPVEASLIALTPGEQSAKNVLQEAGGLIGRLMISPFRNSTSQHEYEHDHPAGAPAPDALTRVQVGVLADHNLRRFGANGNYGFFEALNFAGGFNDSRLAAVNNLRAGVPTAEMTQLADSIEASDPFLNPLKRRSLNLIGASLNRSIRVLKPNGKMQQVNYAGQLVTLIYLKTEPPSYGIAM